MKILFVSSEAEPFAKSGGLGDVAGSLPLELSKEKDNEVCLIMPFYKSIKENTALNIEYVCNFYVPLSWRNCYVGIFKKKVGKLCYYFIDNDYYFSSNGYGYENDGERFAFFSKGVLEALMHISFEPNVIHCNDWQCGFIPLFLKAHYGGLKMYSDIKTVFTIHNIEYQGKAEKSFITDVLGVSADFEEAIMHDGMVNAMKTGIELSDKVTTVSKTYSYEIRYEYFSHGLDSVLNKNAHKIQGVINGIDIKKYNPKTDKSIASFFDYKNTEGKRACKAWLQKEKGLFENSDIPMVSIISRLVPHKGMELIERVADELCSLDIQLVILGTGYREYEDLFKTLEYRYRGKVSSNILFSGELASQIYAASDFLLMPSKCEPCGLSQMIAMHYGTIPIVRETGGLVDSVQPINVQDLSGDGFTFKSYNAHDMLGAVKRGIEFYHSGTENLKKVRTNIMKKDFSWKKSAQEYISIYKEIKGVF